MWIKLTGCIMVLFFSVLLGLYYCSRLSSRLTCLRQLYQGMQLLKGEICYRHGTLSEAFLEAGRRCGNDIGAWMEDIGQSLMDKSSATFCEHWNPSVEQLRKRVVLSEEDMDMLKEFGKNLGYLDLQMQESRILIFMEQLDMQMKELRDTMKERQRLYRMLGFLGGCFLIIVLF